MDSEFSRFLDTFLPELHEHLDRANHGLLKLERDPNQPEIMDEIFRSIHTIKGGAGFGGFNHMVSLAHEIEDLLQMLKNSELSIDQNLICCLLHAFDLVRSMAEQIQSKGGDYCSELEDMQNKLQHFKSKKNSHNQIPTKAQIDQGFHVFDDQTQNQNHPVISSAKKLDQNQNNAILNSPELNHKSNTSQTIRVAISILTDLMTLTEDLVLVRNEILQWSSILSTQPLVGPFQRLTQITNELQEQVSKLRMQPLSQTFGVFPRIVRDLSLQCQKKVRLIVAGEETELDRSLIEAIRDPLTHLIRNAIDHGIESPSDRLRSGKAEEGTLNLSAYSESRSIVIELKDDGGGIDLDRVKTRALERGLITAQQFESMTTQDATNLIFLPGFSTAQNISDLSGRGVGMDVVKTNIEKFGGRVETESQLGIGTTIRLIIPLTLAIIPVLIVEVGDHNFAIPQSAIIKLIDFAVDQSNISLEYLGEVPILQFEGHFVELINLRHYLRFEDSSKIPQYPKIIIINVFGSIAGLVVDCIGDMQEIVVKPLSPIVSHLIEFSGSTLLGDGRIALILSPSGLLSRYLALVRNLSNLSQAKEPKVQNPRGQTYLLVKSFFGEHIAIDLAWVLYLDEISRCSPELIGNSLALQHRGAILPVRFLHDFLGPQRPTENNFESFQLTDLTSMVFLAEGELKLGLIVDGFVDIIFDWPVELTQSWRKHIKGSAIIGSKITQILDVQSIFALLRQTLQGANSENLIRNNDRHEH